MSRWMTAHPGWTLALVIVAFVVTNQYSHGAGIVVAVGGIGIAARLGEDLRSRRR